MRKIIFFMISICCCGISYADLGQIQVNSYLSQKLNAAIPITKLPVDADYGNISIGLASSDKFKSSGLSFNPELGFLLFKVIHNGNSAYLRITSSKPINSPVLTFLLHYKLDNDDFYRQYTILLDPLENVVAVPVAGATAQNPIIVYNSNQRPIPVSRKPRVKTSTQSTTATNSSIISFSPNYSSQFVKDHLGNFNKDLFSYTTSKDDTLYVVARFLQLMYPKANLTINQIIIGLGLENYNDLSKPDYAYPAGVEILLAKPENIVKISASDADAYLWDVSLNDGARTGLLQKMASLFDDELQINSNVLFAGTYVKLLESPVIASAPKVNPPPVTTTNKSPSLLDFLLGFKYAILAVILGGLIILLLLTRLRKQETSEYILAVAEPKKEGLLSRLFKRKSSLSGGDEIENVEPVADIDGGITINVIKPNHELTASEREEIRNNNSSDRTIEKNIRNVVSDSVAAKAEPQDVLDELPTAKPLNDVDNELIATLEQILTFDDSREDIRYKLLELYLGANQFAKAHKVHGELSNRLDEDDPLRKNIAALCSRYDFDNLDISSDAQMPANNDLPGNPEPSSLSNRESGRSLEFSSSPIVGGETTATEPVKPEAATLEFSAVKIAPVVDLQSLVPDYHSEDSRRSLDFTSIAQSSSAVVDNKPTVESDREPTIGALTESVGNLDAVVDAQHNFGQSNRQIEFSVPEQPEIVPDIMNPLPELSPADDDAGLLMDNLDEKINLAKMYYHIDEHAKAYELLTEIINNPDSKSDAKQYAVQLINDLGLHG